MGEIQDKEEMAELSGAIIGDGWIQSNERSLFIAGDPTEDRDYYDLKISKLISKLLCPTKPKEFSYWGVYGVSIHNKKAIQKLLDIDLPKGRKGNSVSIPQWVLKSKVLFDLVLSCKSVEDSF